MSIDAQEFMKSYFTSNLDYHDRRAAKNKVGYYALSIYAVVVAGLLIPLVSFAPAEMGWRMLAAALSGSVVVASAIGGLGKFQENWLSSRAVWDALTREEQWYRHGVHEYKSADGRDALFVERVTAILSREGAEFIALHSRADAPASATSKSTRSSVDPPPVF